MKKIKLHLSMPHKEGQEIPLFYLPIYNENIRNSVKCWLFPLAPFILIYKILEEQRVDVDGISGATYSSLVIQDAVQKALLGAVQ